MQIVSQYLQYAFECLKKAAEATDSEAQDSLRKLARKWMLLAEHREQSLSKDTPTRSPLMDGVPHPKIAQTGNKDCPSVSNSTLKDQ
jgi:hypothetical protein